MKNILKQTLFFSLCLLGGVTYGQSGTLYLASAIGVDNIIRYEPMSGKHVIYSTVAGNENHFLLTDMALLLDVKVADNLKVRDFEIIDGLVFFCGESSGGSGFLGWFDINDLFYAGGMAQIDKTLSALGLLTLDNIEVYHDTTGAIRIAGYGVYSYYALNVRLYRAFEAVGTPATGMQYRTLDLRSAGMFGDVSDVVVTDNFVVYLSSDRKQACSPYVGIGITFQPFPKYDMFGIPPFYYHGFQLTAMVHKSDIYGHSIYVVPINNDPYNDNLNDRVYPKMVHSVGDEIAVCTYRKDLDANSWTPPYPTDPCGYALTDMVSYITNYVFDLSALVPSTNNYIQMTSRNMAQLYNGDLVSIDGFEYEPQTHRYIVLHRHESSMGVFEHAVTTFNLGPPVYVESSYQTVFNTSSMWIPTSMCLDGYMYYTVMGHNVASSEYMFWRNSVGSPNGGCDRIVPCPVSTRPLEPEKHFENKALPTAWTPILFMLTNVREEQVFPCVIICN